MNIEELNSCFDSVAPTKEQRERILAGVLKAKNQPFKLVKFYRYATAVAAVFAIGIFAIVYPQISDNTLPAEDNKASVAMEFENSNSVLKGYPSKKESVEPKVENSVPIMQNKSFREEIKATYPKTDGGALEDSAVAMNENSVGIRTIEEKGADAENASFDMDNEQVIPENMTYSQIMSHEVYSVYVPAYFPDSYTMDCAEKYEDGSLQMFFSNPAGEKMYLTIVGEEGYNPENVINPDGILAFDNTKCIGFSVKCDKYYVYYNIDEGTKEDIYKMVTSSAFYNN